MDLSHREKAYEDMFAKDQELHFKIRAKRNKLAGEWAAALLGKKDEAVQEYANKLVSALLSRQQLFSKLRTDFLLANMPVTDAEINEKILEFVTESRKAFMGQILA